jgi:phosphoglycerate dehydrogenase-like enzyme
VWDNRRLLHGRTTVILGVGAIAEHLAERCRLFGMTVIGVSNGRDSVPHFDAILPRDRLAEAASRADFLVVLVPYAAETRHIVDATVLAAMRKDAFLINIARGAVVDESAIPDALDNGWLRAAALDVFVTEPLPAESPLWRDPRVMVSPHISGLTTIAGAAEGFLECAASLERGELPKWTVDRRRGY